MGYTYDIFVGYPSNTNIGHVYVIDSRFLIAIVQ